MHLRIYAIAAVTRCLLDRKGASDTLLEKASGWLMMKTAMRRWGISWNSASVNSSALRTALRFQEAAGTPIRSCTEIKIASNYDEGCLISAQLSYNTPVTKPESDST